MTSGQLPELDEHVQKWALFLDFDGTLAEIAPQPDQVVVADGLGDLLSAIRARLDGALAIVSGRPIQQIEHFIPNADITKIGLHGGEILSKGDEIAQLVLDHSPNQIRADLRALRDKLAPLVQLEKGLLLEDKSGSLALHYRLAPDREAECRTLVEQSLKGLETLECLDGKMVLEARPSGLHKGEAISHVMRTRKFKSRTPIFAGDDFTDEDGFKAVLALGGIAIKVGDGQTVAQYRAKSPRELTAWLTDLSRSLQTNK